MNLQLLVAIILGGVYKCANPSISAEQHPGVPSKEIFVLPAGYRGPFIAVYAQANTAQPYWRGDTAVYNVPASGVVRLPYGEPPHTTKTSHVFANEPLRSLDNYPTCEDMRLRVADPAPRVCWFGFSAGGTGIPDHIVAVVTDWLGIPSNFNRTSFVYDSVLFQGKGKVNTKWEEPPEILKRRPTKGTQ